MVRLLEAARSAARQRRAQRLTTTPPRDPEMADVLETECASPQVDVTEHLVPVMGECPPIASQDEFFPPGARDRNKRGRVRGHGSRMATREILADIAHNVLPNDQPNGDDLMSTKERNDARTPHGRGGRIRGRGRGGRGRRHGIMRSLSERAQGSCADPRDILGPVGWTAPQIRSQRQSPILLRPRCPRVEKGGTNFDVSGDMVDLTTMSTPWGSVANNDRGQGFSTPPRQQSPKRASEQRASQPSACDPVGHSASGFCRFSVLDFTPGAPPPSAIERQSLGEYHPNLHDCGVGDCPFTKISPESRIRAAQEGMQVEGNTSPGDHPKVDHRAFPHPVFVNARMDVLGQDSSLWVGVEHFTGEVQHRYYHEVHGCPMFTIDFGGSIGVRELRVCDTELGVAFDISCMGGTKRVLDFGILSEASPDETAAMGINEHRVTSDIDKSDGEWEGAFEDFVDHCSSGMSSPCSAGSMLEDPLRDLGFYDESEDTSRWPFDKLWADDQWMEPNLTFARSRGDFRGPTPGPTGPKRAVPAQPVDYFMKYWPVDVRERIIVETNR